MHLAASRPMLAGLLVLALTGCAGQEAAGRSGAERGEAPEPSVGTSTTAPVAPPTASSIPSTAAVPGPPPNELGVVPVLMYHQLLPRPRGVYDITHRAFRAELERLAGEGYVPVTAADYTAGRIDIPAGRHPVVLTFDDSTTSQLAFDESGEPVARTAVAILADVAARHPGFAATATFYVNRDPFADRGGTRTLGWLRDHGFEVGNHTLDHVPLASLSAGRVRRQLAGDTAMIQRATGGAGPVTTLALPFGVRPGNRRMMMAGSWRGTRYAFDGAFLVGAGPAPSPFARDFDRTGIPRIRSQGRRGPEARFGSTAWLDRLANRPGQRYTSDGDPATVSYPAGSSQMLSARARAVARPY